MANHFTDKNKDFADKNKDFIFKSLTNCWSLKKTLRFKLIPQGKTLDYINEGILKNKNKEEKKLNILENDEKLHKDSQKVKEYINAMHRDFITRALESAKVDDWDKLRCSLEESEKLLKEQRKESSKERKDELNKKSKMLSKGKEQLLKAQRKALLKCFKELDGIYKDFNTDKTSFINHPKESSKPDECYLYNWMKKHGYTEEDTEVLKTFKGNTTYFRPFMGNRANMYLLEGEATSVFTRAVDKNFKIFLANMKHFSSLVDKYPHLKNCSGYDEDLKSINCYNDYLSPNGIEKYNNCIGQINEALAEENQSKRKEEKIKLFKKLQKQILCKGESSFFIPKKIENDAELVACLERVKTLLSDENRSENDEDNRPILDLQEAISLLDKESKEIPIKVKNIRFLWEEKGGLLESAVTECIQDVKGPFKDEEKDLIDELREGKNKTVSLKQVIDSYNYINNNEEQIKVSKIVENQLNSLNSRKKEVRTTEKDCFGVCKRYEKSNKKEILAKDEDIEAIKNYLDKIKQLECIKNTFMVKSDDIQASKFNLFLSKSIKGFNEFDKIYDQVRNYVTQKPYSKDKIILTFGIAAFADGWDRTCEHDHHAIILRRDNQYYLGVFKKRKFVDLNDIDEDNTSEYYEKLIYKQRASNKSKMSSELESLFVTDKEVPSNINKIHNSKTYEQNPQDLQKYIKFFIEELKNHEWNKQYNLNFKDPSEYASYKEFCDDLDAQDYSIFFKKISVSKIDELVEEGKLLLFQIYSKDFSEHSTGAKNLHTLYWEQLFSEENFHNRFPLKLDGGASVYYRKASIKNSYTHKDGEVLVNKTYLDKDGNRQTIPDEIYKAICEIENGQKKKDDFSKEIRREIERIEDVDWRIKHKATYDITKDRRYTEDHFQFHVPITINRRPSNPDINQEVLKIVKDSDKVTFLGIDRGIRHLLYLTLVEKDGTIKFQKSLNIVSSKSGKEEIRVDYHSKLDIREKEMDEARKSWKSIGKISDLKQGYLSNVVYEIAKIIVEYNAVVVMEDLTVDFKRLQIKFGKQVYQKFEKQLIDKLGYLAFKPTTGIDEFSNGGIARGYQLAPKLESFADLGKQHGIIFYVDPWNTSRIDPVTGFMNLFRFPKVTDWEEFFKKFDLIRFDKEKDYFIFKFDYSNFDEYSYCSEYSKEWSLCSYGEKRLHDKKNEMGKFETEPINVTSEIKQLFDRCAIEYQSGEDLRDQITKMEKKDLKDLSRLFRQLCDLRNTKTGGTSDDDDYILSPVADKNGNFYDSRNARDANDMPVPFNADANGAYHTEREIKQKKQVPCNADANGAYHIALKGLQLAKGIQKNKDDNLEVPSLKRSEWVEWIQKFHDSEIHKRV